MKKLRWLVHLFTLIGLGLLTGAFFTYRSTAEFIDTASTAEGEVIDLVRSSSTSSSGSSGSTYRPVVTYLDQHGKTVEFISTAGSNPPSYRRGERVKVFYSQDNPQAAKIDGFFSLWGMSMIMGLIGSVFTLFGAGFTVPARLKKRRGERLLREGTPVQSKLQGVERNSGVRVNGRSPFRVVSQWQDPRNGEIHVFTSTDLWFDPTDYLTDREILVYIDTENPSHHHMDISFLPKMAGD